MTPKRELSSRIKPWLPVLLGVALTTLLAFFVKQKNNYEIFSYTLQLSQRAEHIIQDRFEHFEYGLRATRGAIVTAGADRITRRQFETYIGTRDLEREFPGALGFGYIQKVSPPVERAFLKKIRSDGAPDFRIKTLTPHNADRFIVKYLYPQQPNSEAIGLDIGSESKRRAAAIAAARENRIFLTEPMQLLQEVPGKSLGALMLLPVFGSGGTPLSGEDRIRQVVGWSFTPLNINKVLHDLPPLLDQAYITLTRKSDLPPFFTTPAPEDGRLRSVSVTKEIKVVGQSWLLTVSPNPSSVNRIQYWPLHWIVLGGLVMTFLVNQGISLLRVNTGPKDAVLNDFKYGSRKKFYEYLHSPQFRKTAQTTALITGFILITTTVFLYQYHKGIVRNDLSKAKQTTLQLFKKDAEKYRGDLLFLSKTPPVIALNVMVSQRLTGFDSSSTEQWNARLADIFKAYMQTNPAVLQVRLVEKSDHWQETVKVERHSSELVSVPSAFLQPLDDMPFLPGRQNPDRTHSESSVRISDISLSSGQNPASAESPVWQFSIEIHRPDGTPFGIIILDISLDELLKTAVETLPAKTELFLSNPQYEFALHPNKHQTFSVDIIRDPVELRDFAKLDQAENRHRLVSVLLEHESRDLWLSQATLTLEGADKDKVIRIFTTKPRFPTVYELILQTTLVLFLMLMMAGISILIHYWTWLSNEIKQRDERLTQLQSQKEKEMLRFKILLDSAPDATLIVDKQGIIQLANEQATRVFGYPREQLEGHPIDKLIPTARRAAHKGHVSGYIAAPKTRPMGKNSALFALGADGVEFPVEISLGSVKQDDEVLISASIRDISERLVIEEKLRVALSNAERATEAKSAFLANTSHEIRIPLNAILGLTQLLKDESLSNDQKNLVSKIDISGNALLGIVNDVLDLSKIEANEMTLEKAPVNLRQLLEEITSIFALQTKNKALAFKVSLIDPLPEWVLSDSTRIRQILTNLLSNAVKFTETGEIALSVSAIDTVSSRSEPVLSPDNTPIKDGNQNEVRNKQDTQGQNTPRIRFTITDTGIGIPLSAQARLFTPFTQADNSTTRQFGGTGLGLSIVRKLTELLEGDLGFSSHPAEGSSFWVELPLQVYTPDQDQHQKVHEASLSILILDHPETKEKALAGLASAMGWRCQQVSEASDLLRLLTEGIREHHPLPDALLICGSQVSETQWHEIRLLADRKEASRFPAIVLTSKNGMTDLSNAGFSDEGLTDEKLVDQELADMGLAELIHDHLSLPTSASDLFNSINAAVTAQTGNPDRVITATQSDALKAKWLPDTHILAVDDSAINLEVVEHILKKNGARVVAVSGGFEALHQLQENPTLFDAVLMDVQMPDLDGLETTRRIRQQLNLKTLPIIALTAGALSEEKKRALEAGMNDFITKPILPSMLIRALRLGIRNYRGRDIRIQGEHQIEETVPDWPSIDGLNGENSKQLLMGDKGLFFKTLRRLLLDNRNLMESPPSEAALKKSTELRRSLTMQMHKLRSTAGMLGAETLHQAASRTEYLLKSGETSVSHLISTITKDLKTIAHSGTPALEAWYQTLSLNNAEESQASMPQEQLDKLIKLLTHKDLEALEMIEANAASLRYMLGEDNFETLQQHLETLNFAQVLALFEPLTTTSPKPSIITSVKPTITTSEPPSKTPE